MLHPAFRRAALTRLLACVAFLWTAVCVAAEPSAITVFAAASLKESLDTVAANWERRSAQRVRVSYGASSTLAQQIEQGAPAQVYVSADEAWMDHLQSRGAVDGASRFDLLSNRLVLIAPAASALTDRVLADRDALQRALRSDRLAVAEIEGVPAGRYAKQALTHMGLWAVVADRLAQGENVRAAMAFVARGEAPLGIVYATDAAVEPRVRVLSEFDPGSHDAIVYPVARVTSVDPRVTRGLLDYLRGAEAGAVFRAAGFTLP